MRHVLILVAGLVCGAATWAQAPQVTEVTAKQFGSFVRIAYDLTGPADTPIAVSFAASNDGGVLFSLPLTEVHGDVGTNLSPGTGKVALWDAGTDLPDSINGDVRIWVKTWIPNAARITLVDTDFVFVYADGHDTGGTLRETQLPGFYVTPCPVSTDANAPAIPEALTDAYPEFAFEVFQDTAAGESWAALSSRTPWADVSASTCAAEAGWRIAAHYWPSGVDAGSGPDMQTRPWQLGDSDAVSGPLLLDTTTLLRDSNEDGVADDKTDLDQDGVYDAYQDYDGDGVADAFEDANADEIADAYGSEGTGDQALTGFADTNANQLPDYFESRYPITSTTHPRGDRVYFNGSFSGIINDYQPDAAGYRWRIAPEASVTLEAGDTALAGSGPHGITAEPGDGIHYLHVAAVNESDEIIQGSSRRFVFNASLQPPVISSETHPEPDYTSDRRVFGARLEAPYGPKGWQSETGDSWTGSSMLAFRNTLWLLQLNGDVWQSSGGFNWTTAPPAAPWTNAGHLSATVFREQLWVYASNSEADEGGLGQFWTTSDGVEWIEKTGLPWADREAPSLTVFRDALYVFGGVTYLEDGTPATENSVWRSEDGETWQQVAASVPWATRKAPNVVPFGDSLWMNVVPAAFAGAEVPTDAWRSWDGVHWVPVGLAEPQPAELPGAGAWRGWDNGQWRYYGYPWLGIFTGFSESLWYAGSDPRLPVDTAHSGDVWHYDADRIFRQAVESFNPPTLSRSDIASYHGRIHVIGSVSLDTLHSEYGDRWYNSALYTLRYHYDASLVNFNGTLFNFGQEWPRAFDGRTILETAYRTPEMTYRSKSGWVVFSGDLWSLGGYQNGYKNDVLRTENALTWTTVSANAPWAARSQHGAVAFDGSLWVIGGYAGSVYYNDVWRSSDGVTWLQVLEQAPWDPRAEAEVVAYDNALWIFGGEGPATTYHDAWRSTDGILWELVETGVGPFSRAEAVVHQDSLFLLTENGNQPRPVRRYGAARAGLDSLQGMRFVFDQSPDTLPDSAALDSNTYLISEPLPPGDYWLHVGMVDSLGQLGTVAHRAIRVQPVAEPTVAIDSSTDFSQIPGNALNISLDNHQRLPDATTYFGFHATPGGDADTALSSLDFTLPCVAEGTYWLVAQSVDMYGIASERFEQEITVGPPAALPGPTMHFEGLDPKTEDKVHVYAPEGREVKMYPHRLSTDTAYLIVDQRYGLATDFSEATPVPATGFPVPLLDVGRHYFHAITLDNCDLPSEESVLSALVLQGSPRYVGVERPDPDGPVILNLAWDDFDPRPLDIRYVIDNDPNTDPTMDSTAFFGKSFEIPVPDEASWEFYVHVAEVEGPNHLSETSHFLLRSDETGFVAVQGPYYDRADLKYYVFTPGAQHVGINPTFMRVLPLVDGVKRKVTIGHTYSNVTSIRVARTPDGPVYLEFPLGSIGTATGFLPATGPTATGYIDHTPPALIVEGPEEDTGASDPLVFRLSAPDADDLYLPERVFTLVQYPSKVLSVQPMVEMEAGIWTVTYTDVAQYGAVRLLVPKYDPNTAGETYTDCVGYDWAGNCLDGYNSDWLDYGTTVPEVTITPPSKAKFSTGPVEYTLNLSKPTVNALEVNDLVLESDPPGGVAATMSLTRAGEGRYSLVLSNVVGDGSIQLRVPQGFAVDRFGAQSAEVVSEARTVDNTPPEILFDAPQLPESLGGPVVFRFRIEGGKTVPTPLVRLNTTGNVTATLNFIKLNTPAGTYHYEAIVSNYLGKGTVSIDVPGTGIRDDVQNEAAGTRSPEVEVGVYRVTLTASGQGSTMPAPGTFLFPADTVLQLQALPSAGEAFERWSISGFDSFTATTEILVAGHVKVHAYFSGSLKHVADLNADGHLELNELLRVIQFYNSGGLQCAPLGVPTEDGFVSGAGIAHSCLPHATDYSPQDWEINLQELLRMVQFYNSDGYAECEDGEDGFCAVNTH